MGMYLSLYNLINFWTLLVKVGQTRIKYGNFGLFQTSKKRDEYLIFRDFCPFFAPPGRIFCTKKRDHLQGYIQMIPGRGIQMEVNHLYHILLFNPLSNLCYQSDSQPRLSLPLGSSGTIQSCHRTTDHAPRHAMFRHALPSLRSCWQKTPLSTHPEP